MSRISKYKILSKAKENFSNQNYEEAMRQFALVLENFPNSDEAYNGVILSEMAMSDENGAETLFDYYEILKSENFENADKVMKDLLKSLDNSLEAFYEIFQDPLEDKIESEDGIVYSDLKKLLKKDEDFKEVFENIMFSTKVIITKKEDFIDLLEHLIKYDFTEMAMSYLESALNIYPEDEKLGKLFRELLEKGKNN
ncbi:FIG00469423: hypothetical protein [hydrothermal vent metagenome]|uniref:Tetratricopeptide repeat protein n=1 Tax=hydrothermal vent metagenome TaxID=652676 RepID=A0A1W1D2L5_9ZZZZ